jgi:putative ABC transport system substrate-binding protein
MESGQSYVKDIQAAAPALGVTVYAVEVKGVDDFERAFAAVRGDRAGAVLLSGDPLFGVQRTRIIEFATKRRLPVMYAGSEAVEAGGLMSYSDNRVELYRRVAIYVDRILKGAKPADLPWKRR